MAVLLALLALLTLWPAANSHSTPPASDLAAAVPSPQALQAGRQLMLQYQCGACHRIDGISGASGQSGPALNGFAQRSYIAGRVPNTALLLARWIAQPQSLLPGTAMPDLGVPPAQARLIAATLRAPQ